MSGHDIHMHAIEVSETGGPEVLRYVEVPQPTPGPGEVLIKAEAIGVNYIDTYFRSGQYPRELPFILGSEMCGTVVATGEGADGFHEGERVVTSAVANAFPAGLPVGTVHITGRNVVEIEPAARLDRLEVVRIFDYGLRGIADPETPPPRLQAADRRR